MMQSSNGFGFSMSSIGGILSNAPQQKKFTEAISSVKQIINGSTPTDEQSRDVQKRKWKSLVSLIKNLR